MGEDIFRFVLITLACYRLARLFTTEDGPFNIFKSMRTYLGRWANNAKVEKRMDNQIADFAADLFHCPFCFGVWLALVVALIFYTDQWFLYWLAIAGGQSWLQSKG